MTKIIFSLTFLLLVPFSTSAGIMNNMNSAADSGGFDVDETDEKTMSAVVGTVINAFLSLLGVIFVALIVYGGALWMTDAGNNEQVQKAKKLISHAVIGLIITTSAWVFWLFIFKKILI